MLKRYIGSPLLYFSAHKKKLAISLAVYVIGTAIFLYGLHLENLVLQITGPVIVTLSKIYATIALFLPALRRFFSNLFPRV